MILLESITTRLQQDYPKFTLSFLWFYRNHYGKFTASFEQIPNVYFEDVKKWLGRGLCQVMLKVLIPPLLQILKLYFGDTEKRLGRGLIQWLPKVIIPPCPFSCFRCVLRCVPFPCVLKSLFLLRSTVRSSVLRNFQWIPAWIPVQWIPINKGISKQLHPDFFWSILCHLLDCHLALVEFDFRFSGRKW